MDPPSPFFRCISLVIFGLTLLIPVVSAEYYMIEFLQVSPYNATQISDLTTNDSYAAKYLLRLTNSPIIESSVRGILYDFGTPCTEDDIQTNIQYMTGNVSLTTTALIEYTDVENSNCLDLDAMFSLIDDHVEAILLAWDDPTLDSASSSIPVYVTDTDVASKIREINGGNTVMVDSLGLLTTFLPPVKASTAWQYVLIVIVALLALAFIVSIALHYYLFKRRRENILIAQQNENEIQRINMGNLLDVNVIESLPIFVYSKEDYINKQKIKQRNRKLSNKEKVFKNPLVNDINTETEKIVNDYNNINTTENADLMDNKFATKNNNNEDIIKSSSVNIVEFDRAKDENDKEAKYNNNIISDAKIDIDNISLSSARTVEGYIKDFSCAICICEYEEGDLLREIPCGHLFHNKCIDPWLLGSSPFCPLCKDDVRSRAATLNNNNNETNQMEVIEIGNNNSINESDAIINLQASVPINNEVNPDNSEEIQMKEIGSSNIISGINHNDSNSKNSSSSNRNINIYQDNENNVILLDNNATSERRKRTISRTDSHETILGDGAI